MQRFVWIFFFILSSAATAGLNSETQDKVLQKLADRYIDDVYFINHPISATEAGVHRYDHLLGNYSRQSIQFELSQLKNSEKEIARIQPTDLSPWARDDRDILLNQIRSLILDLGTIQSWHKDPDFYSSNVTNGIFTLIHRDFAPQNERLVNIIAREKLIPQALAAARANLTNPPKIFTEIAIQQLPGDIQFFSQDLPKALESTADPALMAQFKETNATTIQALQVYLHWLKTDLLPRSQGDFKLGAKIYQKKLALDEMVDVSLEKLIQLNDADTQLNSADFIRTAKIIDPTKTPQAVQKELASHHPTPSELLTAFRNSYNSVISFIEKEHILTLPDTNRPEIIETPPFLRATTFASMDAPGPFETGSKTAFFSVTLPDSEWSPAEIEDYMSSFTYPLIYSTTIHEAYPGHYVQFVFAQQLQDRVRRLFYANSNVEGWAHYTEQMMWDAGFNGNSITEKDKAAYHLGQLQDALLRNARFTVGIKLHTGQMTFKQAVRYFETTAYLSKEGALMEAKRGTSDPTYIIYTLGKLQILKLRTDYAAQLGSVYSLQKFHDVFLQQGYAPIKIVRRALLHNDSPSL